MKPEQQDADLSGGTGEHRPEQGAVAPTRTLTLYRDDSTAQVVYADVKHYFWTAGNTVLTIAQLTDKTTGAHRYIHWPRERFCWFKEGKG